MFLIYINDLPRGFHADIKLFTDDTSLFSVVDDIDESASKLNNDLIRIQEWPYQWKMSFNPGRTKPAHEVMFSRKTKNIISPNLYFNNVPIVKKACQKHLGLNLDVKLTFNDSSIIKEGFGSFLEKKGWLKANVTRMCLSFEHFLKK